MDLNLTFLDQIMFLQKSCQYLANFALRYADAVESMMAGHVVNAMPTLDKEEAEEWQSNFLPWLCHNFMKYLFEIFS